MAVRDVHGPDAGGHPAGCSDGKFAATAVPPWCTGSAADASGAQLPSGRSCRVLRGQVHAIFGCHPDDEHRVPSSAASAHSGRVSGASPSPAASPHVATPASVEPGRFHGRERRLPTGEQPTHDRAGFLQANDDPGPEPGTVGRLERVRLRRDATPSTSPPHLLAIPTDTREEPDTQQQQQRPPQQRATDQTTHRDQHRWPACQHPEHRDVR